MVEYWQDYVTAAVNLQMIRAAISEFNEYVSCLGSQEFCRTLSSKKINIVGLRCRHRIGANNRNKWVRRNAVLKTKMGIKRKHDLPNVSI
jgi:hypothetical protein